MLLIWDGVGVNLVLYSCCPEDLIRRQIWLHAKKRWPNAVTAEPEPLMRCGWIYPDRAGNVAFSAECHREVMTVYRNLRVAVQCKEAGVEPGSNEVLGFRVEPWILTPCVGWFVSIFEKAGVPEEQAAFHEAVRSALAYYDENYRPKADGAVGN